MQLNVIRGPQASGKTTTLRRLAKSSDQLEQIINAEHLTEAGLEMAVIDQVQRGATAVFINDCTELQLGRLDKLARRYGKGLQIHAVVAV